MSKPFLRPSTILLPLGKSSTVNVKVYPHKKYGNLTGRELIKRFKRKRR